jgi:hypothetical protein
VWSLHHDLHIWGKELEMKITLEVDMSNVRDTECLISALRTLLQSLQVQKIVREAKFD